MSPYFQSHGVVVSFCGFPLVLSEHFLSHNQAKQTLSHRHTKETGNPRAGQLHQVKVWLQQLSSSSSSSTCLTSMSNVRTCCRHKSNYAGGGAAGNERWHLSSHLQSSRWRSTERNTNKVSVFTYVQTCCLGFFFYLKKTKNLQNSAAWFHKCVYRI